MLVFTHHYFIYTNARCNFQTICGACRDHQPHYHRLMDTELTPKQYFSKSVSACISCDSWLVTSWSKLSLIWFSLDCITAILFSHVFLKLFLLHFSAFRTCHTPQFPSSSTTSHDRGALSSVYPIDIYLYLWSTLVSCRIPQKIQGRVAYAFAFDSHSSLSGLRRQRSIVSLLFVDFTVPWTCTKYRVFVADCVIWSSLPITVALLTTLNDLSVGLNRTI